MWSVSMETSLIKCGVYPEARNKFSYVLNRLSKASYVISGGFGARLARTTGVGQVLNWLAVLLVSSHVGRLNSKEVSLGCLSDIGLDLWSLHLGDVEFD